MGGRGLGMDLKQLEKFMTRLRKDPDGVLRFRLIPVVLHCLEGVRATNAFKWIDGPGNQPGLPAYRLQ